MFDGLSYGSLSTNFVTMFVNLNGSSPKGITEKFSFTNNFILKPLHRFTDCLPYILNI